MTTREDFFEKLCGVIEDLHDLRVRRELYPAEEQLLGYAESVLDEETARIEARLAAEEEERCVE